MASIASFTRATKIKSSIDGGCAELTTSARMEKHGGRCADGNISREANECREPFLVMIVFYCREINDTENLSSKV